MRALIVELRRAAVQHAAGLRRDFDAIVEAATDVATDDEHDPEGHTIAWERQQVAALLDQATDTIAELDAAQQRLDQGGYGVCVTCQQPISPERLLALPVTAHCIECARQRPASRG